MYGHRCRCTYGCRCTYRLASYLNVEPKWQHGEVPREHHVITVDPGGVLLVEGTQAVYVDGRTELYTGDF